MPASQPPRRSHVRKQRQNNRVEQDVIGGEMFLFGRVLKKLGHKQFEVCFVDTENHFYDKASARIRAKNCALIELGNIVVMVPDGRTMEILGKLMPDTVRLLVKEGRINDVLLTAEPEDEGAFEFCDEPAVTSVEDKEGEIDISAI
jgi:hypothetical protein